MALQKDITMDSGVNLPNAYIRICSIKMLVGISMVLDVEVYKDQSTRNDGLKPVVTLVHRCVTEFHEYFGSEIVNQENVCGMKKSYEWLKTIPFYAEATDVLDVKE